MSGRWPAVVLAASLVPLGAPSAFSQTFAGAEGLSDALAVLGARAAALRAQPLRPAAAPAASEPRHGVMGASRFEDGRTATSQSLPPGPFGAAGAPDVSRYAVRGVDISHYEGDIAWDMVKLDGLSFVYIKATEGGDGVDEKFAANWSGASSAGLLKGAYHFYNFCKGGAEQAANFVSIVPPDADVLPMTVDLEESSSCKTMPKKAAFRKGLAAFVKKIRAVYGQRPVLYVNYSIYQKYFQGENDSYKLWIADTSHAAPALPDGSSWTMWQYGWHGQVAGIPGEVDLDVFNGTPEMLAALTGPSDVMVASLP